MENGDGYVDLFKKLFPNCDNIRLSNGEKRLLDEFLLQILPAMEFDVMRFRYGLGEENFIHMYNEIEAETKITEAFAKKLVKSAISKLKAPDIKERLELFTEPRPSLIRRAIRSLDREESIGRKMKGLCMTMYPQGDLQIAVNEELFTPETYGAVRMLDNADTLVELSAYTKEELLKEPNFDEKCLKEVKKVLGRFGLALRTKGELKL